jgi:hypothetical protein
MRLLPESTSLGKLSITVVYEAYDTPCLFACQNTLGQIYLAILIDENEDCKKWLYNALSKERFEYAKAGSIDLYNIFKLAESNVCYIVIVPLLESDTCTVKIISCNELSNDMLPLPNYKLYDYIR